MGAAYERHSLGTRQRFALMGRADRKLLGFAFLFFSYAHPRVGAQRTKSGWHLWIFILDLDQLASFFLSLVQMLVLPFTWKIKFRRVQ